MLRLNTSPPSYLTIIKPRVYYPIAYLIYFRFRIMCISPVRYTPDLASPPSHAHTLEVPRSISTTRESALTRSDSSLLICHRIGNAHLRTHF